MCGFDSAASASLASLFPPLRPLPAGADTVTDWASLVAQGGRVYDAHCHPTDILASVAVIPSMHAAALTVMSTRAQDQHLVAELARDQPDKVKPAFGWHPWFTHQLWVEEEKDGKPPKRDAEGGDRPMTDLAAKRRYLASVLTPVVDPDNPEDKNWPALDALARSLPEVRPLSALIDETRARLRRHPGALVGEIGLDKAFRVPEPAASGEGKQDSKEIEQDHRNGTDPLALTPGSREGRRLSPFRVQPAHQVAVLVAQLQLAAELGRPVSVHGVQAHGLLFGVLAGTWRGWERKDVLSRRDRHQIAGVADEVSSDSEDDDDGDDEDEETDKTQPNADTDSQPVAAPPRPYPPAICLHSFSGPVEVMRQYLDPHIPAAIYFSFSTLVNCSSAPSERRTEACVTECPDDRLLVESDLHTAGEHMDSLLEDVYRRVCAIKRWPLEEGVARIASNYEAFLSAKEASQLKMSRPKKSSARGGGST